MTRKQHLEKALLYTNYAIEMKDLDAKRSFDALYKSRQHLLILKEEADKE